jgi:hypothetical protein
MNPSGPMRSRDQSWHHGPETVTKTETVLRVIKVLKHKINIINKKKFQWACVGPEFPMNPSGPMRSRNRSRHHGHETVTETETVLRVIKVLKHKINIINEEKFQWACVGPEFPMNPSGPIRSRDQSRYHGPETVTKTETVLRVIKVLKHKINIINEEKFQWTCMGPEFPMNPSGPMRSRDRSRNHGPETVIKIDTVLRVIKVLKHKINIINEEKFQWACVGLEFPMDPSGPMQSQDLLRHPGPETVKETETVLRVIKVSKHKINIINDCKFQWDCAGPNFRRARCGHGTGHGITGPKQLRKQKQY